MRGYTKQRHAAQNQLPCFYGIGRRTNMIMVYLIKGNILVWHFSIRSSFLDGKGIVTNIFHLERPQVTCC